MEQDNISKKIKEIRINNNMTQKEFADKLGVTFQSVSKWENGKNIPDITLLNKISNDFCVSLESLINGSVVVKKKNNKYIIGIFLILVIVVSFILINILKSDEVLKLLALDTTSSDFKVEGSLVVSGESAIIHVSSIEYLGLEKDMVYDSITFTLIEEDNNKLNKISEQKREGNVLSFESVFEDIYFKIDNYSPICLDFNCKKIYIKILAVEKNGKTRNYEIPFSYIENCDCPEEDSTVS